MFTKHRGKLPPLSEAERTRLREIVFYTFISQLLNAFRNPNKVLDFIESYVTLFDCSKLIINKIILCVFQKDPRYRPERNELLILLYRSGVPIRQIHTQLRISNSTLYKQVEEFIADPYVITPKFNKDQNAEIKKFIACYKELHGILTL